MNCKDKSPLEMACFFKDIEVEFLIHELKDPVSIIETGARTLLEKQDKYGTLSKRQEKTMKRALRNSKKIREMLSTLLEVGRSEANAFHFTFFNPKKVIDEVLKDSIETMASDIFDQIENHNTTKNTYEILSENGIVVDISQNIANTELNQDEVKFRRISGNLFKNALHYRRNQIEIRLFMEFDNLILSVKDDGPGIDKKYHDIIFQQYARINTGTSQARSGHGLGLAGAQVLARSLGGDINLTSKKEDGATFRLMLPFSFNQNK
ncbi:MAG: HAMP domain-containing histidine kinase [Desulfobacterales bacterium]|nr:HAMP domain-containing histidine kinase [Desulfobacterales bacterium]